MAEIVKKIGRITKYETTEYVGGAKMLDLDRAAAATIRSRATRSSRCRAERCDPEESQTGEFTAVIAGAATTPVAAPHVRPPTSVELADSAAEASHDADRRGCRQLAALRELAAELPGATTERRSSSARSTCSASCCPGRALACAPRRPHARADARLRARRAPARRHRRPRASRSRSRRSTPRALKSAVAASARVVIRDRWDSPFTGIATGFALPLAAGGELYGVLDIGYAPGADAREADEPGVRRVRRTHLAVALRTLAPAGRRDRPARLPGAPARRARTR